MTDIWYLYKTWGTLLLFSVIGILLIIGFHDHGVKQQSRRDAQEAQLLEEQELLLETNDTLDAILEELRKD